jgi:arylsulfatase A
VQHFKRREFIKTLGMGTLALALNNCRNTDQISSRPNIIYILADDLGYGDLSCYGQTKFQTPNIDILAAEGMRFTQHYAGSTVCAPSRSALMTGLHTGHTPVRGNREHKPEGQYPLPEKTITVAKMLKKAGYATGAFGKWGLGYPSSTGDPNNQGFDEFFGYNCQRIAHHYYPWHLWHNGQKIILEENKGLKRGVYAPELIHKKALQFIEIHKDEPFFLYVPSIIPHAELFAPEEYMQRFRGKFLPEKSFKGQDELGKGFKTGSYGSQPEGHTAWVAMITLLDDQVRQIMEKVKELGLDKNTIIMFSSDNGPHEEGGADPDYFNSNGSLRGIKRDLYEGGIRVPFIVRWNDHIKAGSTSEHVSAFWDMMPTFSQLAGVSIPEEIDGISILPTLTGRDGKQVKHDYLYWEFSERDGAQAIRMGDWKAVRNGVKNRKDTRIEIYNLKNDPSEQKNLTKERKDILEQITPLFEKARIDSKDFPLFKNPLKNDYPL